MNGDRLLDAPCDLDKGSNSSHYGLGPEKVIIFNLFTYYKLQPPHCL